jgi:hypothetical protein
MWLKVLLFDLLIGIFRHISYIFDDLEVLSMYSKRKRTILYTYYHFPRSARMWQTLFPKLLNGPLSLDTRWQTIPQDWALNGERCGHLAQSMHRYNDIEQQATWLTQIAAAWIDSMGTGLYYVVHSADSETVILVQRDTNNLIRVLCDVFAVWNSKNVPRTWVECNFQSFTKCGGWFLKKSPRSKGIVAL